MCLHFIVFVLICQALTWAAHQAERHHVSDWIRDAGDWVGGEQGADASLLVCVVCVIGLCARTAYRKLRRTTPDD